MAPMRWCTKAICVVVAGLVHAVQIHDRGCGRPPSLLVHGDGGLHALLTPQHPLAAMPSPSRCERIDGIERCHHEGDRPHDEP